MRLLLVALLALSATACGSLRPHVATGGTAPGVPLAQEAAPEPPEDEGRGLATEILLYLPNRVLDALDVAKAGVDVGPGAGLELKATDAAQVVALSTVALGVGFQGLRHLPFRAGPEAAFGIGPIRADASLGGWPRSGTEVRVGAHLLIVGAHASIDPWEIVDLVLGFALIDVADDDL